MIGLSTFQSPALKRAFAAATAILFVVSADAQKRLTPHDYIDMWGEVAVGQMVTHHIPASITLAQGILESGNGNSDLAARSNNHFGIKCHSDWDGRRTYHDDDEKGECFRVYKNAAESFDDHSAFLKRSRYAELFELDITDYKGWARGLKKCGYATNPKYAGLLIDLVERYELQRFDEEGLAWKGSRGWSAKKTSPARKTTSQRRVCIGPLVGRFGSVTTTSPTSSQVPAIPMKRLRRSST